jgi:hypothetical protein
MNIDAVMILPDSNQVEISREKNMTSDTNIKLSVSFEVQTYYPAYKKEDNDSFATPKKTKWYSNIIQSRNNANAMNRNSNDDKDINNQK